MQLIGMLDSPYVRRVAVAMLAAGVAFEHRPISLFRHIEAFTALSPLLKAPSLIAEDGAALVDSGVILEYLATRSPALAALRPQSLPAFRALATALTVMEKSVQIHYERALRSPGEQSESWRARVMRQLRAGLDALEASAPEAWFEGRLGHADIAVACACGFLHGALADVVAMADYPRLAAYAARAEALPAFVAAPAVDGVVAGGLR
ncbi:MAG: glutathione S-transferase N-terminal domain-containing protein [Pseudomonadota bacterium]|nr:glutathione S-transferase N-terminal domain-containing protein [Pseudomonadota bacterium]